MPRFLLLILMVLLSSLLTNFVIDGRGRSQIRRNLMQSRGHQNVMTESTPVGAFGHLQKGEINIDLNEEKILNHLAGTAVKNYQREYFNQKLMTPNIMRYSDEKKKINSRGTNPFYQNFYSIHIKDSPVFRISYYMQPDIYKSITSQAPTPHNSNFLFDSNSFENSLLDKRREHKNQYSINEARNFVFSGVYSRDVVLVNAAERKKILHEIIEKELAKGRNIMVQRPEMWIENNTQSLSRIIEKKLKMPKVDAVSCQEKWMISLSSRSAGGDDRHFSMSKQYNAIVSENNIEGVSHNLSKKKTMNNTGEEIIGTNFTKTDGESISVQGIKINTSKVSFHKGDEENKILPVVLTQENSFQNFRNKEVIPDNQSYFKNSPIIYVSDFKISNPNSEKNNLWREFANRDRYAGNMFSSEPAESQIQTEKKNDSTSLRHMLKKQINYDSNIGNTTTILTNNSKSTVDEEEIASELYHSYDIDDISSDYGESEWNDEDENIDSSRSIILSREENISQLKEEDLIMHQDVVYNNFHSHAIPMNKSIPTDPDNSVFGKNLWSENYSPKIQHLKYSTNYHHPKKESSLNPSSVNREDVLHRNILFQKISIDKDMEEGKELLQRKNSTYRNHSIYHADKAEGENSQMKSHEIHGTTAVDNSSKNRNYKLEGNQKFNTTKTFGSTQSNKKKGSEKGKDSMDSSIHKKNISKPSEVEQLPKKHFRKSENESAYDAGYDITTETNGRAYGENYYGDYRGGSLIFGSTLNNSQNKKSFLKEYNADPVKSKKAKGKTYLYGRLNEYGEKSGPERKNPEDEDRQDMLRRIPKPKSLVGTPWRTFNSYLKSDFPRGSTRAKYQSEYHDGKKTRARH